MIGWREAVCPRATHGNVFSPMPATRPRFMISILLGLAVGLLCWYVMRRLNQGAADFIWAIRAARDLLSRHNPYATRSQLYPLPAAFFGLPFVRVRPEIAAGIFYGLSSALLAFGVTRHGYHRLLIFLAFPYWAGMLSVQWIPLIMAAAFFPLLMPATLAKPQIGLPILLTRMGRKGAIACLTLILLSFAVMPQWFPLWLHQLGGYARFIPLFVLPGPLLALALLRFRDREAWLLFTAACMPQRWFYDPFFLWLIPKTRKQIIYTAAISWIPGIWRWNYTPHSFSQVGRWMVLCFYLPMLVILLMRKTLPENQRTSKVPARTDSGDQSEELEASRAE